MGPWRFLLLFLLGGAVSNLAAVVAIGTPDSVIIGASGAVSAVIGAYLALFPNAKLGVVLPLGLFLEFVKAPASLLIGIWALLQVIFAYIGPAFGAVAWSAHIAGFLFGVVFALFVRARLRGGCGSSAVTEPSRAWPRRAGFGGAGCRAATGHRAARQLLQFANAASIGLSPSSTSPAL